MWLRWFSYGPCRTCRFAIRDQQDPRPATYCHGAPPLVVMRPDGSPMAMFPQINPKSRGFGCAAHRRRRWWHRR